ncbi:MAG: hypothetical protein MZW92_37555 [Comamonadaceae bacterium]|nr:hypothetical protein [Comamonadaceae bacterium]
MQTLEQVCGRHPEYLTSIVEVAEGHIGPRDGQADDQVADMGRLGLGAAQKLEPGRGVEEEGLLHHDLGAGCHAAGRNLLDTAPFHLNLGHPRCCHPDGF